MESTKSYYVETGKEAESIEVYVFYRLGGTSWATHKKEERGMCLLVHPVELKNGVKSFAAYSGFKTHMKELKRKSKKEMDYAEKWVEENYLIIAKAFMVDDYDPIWKLVNAYGE